jgi:hypothetical protein
MALRPRYNRTVVLKNLTWPDVDALDRELVALIPTGSLEQHGRHLSSLTPSSPPPSPRA